MEQSRQKIFTEEYCLELKRVVRKGDYSAFTESEFVYNHDAIQECNYVKPEGLLEKMMAAKEGDLFSAAKELYLAFKDLSNLQAMYDPFWIYLSLVDLYPYVARLFPDVDTYKSQYALNHYLMCKYSLYNLRGLWWAMRMTTQVNDNGIDDYSLSEFLLNGPSQLQLSLTESQLFRCENVVKGVLTYFKKHEDQCTREILNKTMVHLNMLGSLKQLACLPVSYFEKVIESQVPLIFAAQNASQESKEKIGEKKSILKRPLGN